MGGSLSSLLLDLHHSGPGRRAGKIQKWDDLSHPDHHHQLFHRLPSGKRIKSGIVPSPYGSGLTNKPPASHWDFPSTLSHTHNVCLLMQHNAHTTYTYVYLFGCIAI